MQLMAYFAQFPVLPAQFKQQYSTRRFGYWAKSRSWAFIVPANLRSNQSHEKDSLSGVALECCMQ